MGRLDNEIPALFYVAPRDRKTGMVYLKIVNAQASGRPFIWNYNEYPRLLALANKSF